jgi:predicted acetyltransferase
MEILQLNGLELQQALYVWSQSFERGDRIMEDWKEWEERTPSGRTTYGILEPAGLQAAFLTVDETIHLGAETTLPMSAVAGVGVLPASRGKGYASMGVRYLLERMRENGQPISFLEPFSWDFYGRLGYAWTAPTRRYAVATRLLKPSTET